MWVSSVTCPGVTAKGRPPTLPVTGPVARVGKAGALIRLNSFVVPIASPIARPSSAPHALDCRAKSATTPITHAPHAGAEPRRCGRRSRERRRARDEIDGLPRIRERPDEVGVAVAPRVCRQEIEARQAPRTEQDHWTAPVAHPVAVLLRGLEDFSHRAGRVAR